ncbi:DNA-processing protein DprA [Bacillus bombysepticus]|uniref:DNA-processing protein DprA n=1 Tax=Bacillus bombysepticus TaxID=658666 RepID=UPI00301A4AA9
MKGKDGLFKVGDFWVEGLKCDIKPHNKFFGIIGSRNPSAKERENAYLLGKWCAQNGYIVVSGLASGVDEAAHKGALDGGGKTIAIVSTTPNENIYPKGNRGLAQRIIQHGCIVYPFEKNNPKLIDGFEDFKRRLIERNLVLAYLCKNVVAVKDERKINGGTKWAMNYAHIFGNKTFRLYGDAFSEGFESHKLIINRNSLESEPEVEKAKVTWKMEIEVNKK